MAHGMQVMQPIDLKKHHVFEYIEICFAWQYQYMKYAFSASILMQTTYEMQIVHFPTKS